MEIWLLRLPRNRVHCVVGRLGLFLRGFIFGFEAFFRWFAALILYWFSHEELVATFDLKSHTYNDLVVEEVICAARIDENGDRLLFKKSSNFHRLRVGVAGQRVHCLVGRLGLFLYGFIFGFEAFIRWLAVLILYWFNHEERPFLQQCSWLNGSSQCQHNPLAERSVTNG
ncbi:hypothetical protein B296_00010320, partial [Ensete ventricosum]